eukprot:1187293-Prorocentrum_minimum.AAC.3
MGQVRPNIWNNLVPCTSVADRIGPLRLTLLASGIRRRTALIHRGKPSMSRRLYSVGTKFEEALQTISLRLLFSWRDCVT